MFMAELSLMIPHKSILRWLSNSLEAWEARYGWNLTLEIVTQDDLHPSHVPQTAPYPPSRMLAHADVARMEESLGYPSFLN